MSTTIIEAETEYDPYFSRVGGDCESVTRIDPVVWSKEIDAVSAGQASNYAENGFLLLPEIFSEQEVQDLLSEADHVQSNWPDGLPGLVREPESQTVRSIFQLQNVSDKFRELLQDPRLVNPVEQLLDSQVYLHQSRINYKLPFDGKEFFWHSDFETWHVEDGMPRMRAISVSLMLTESNEFNGPLMLVPGSHETYVRCAGSTPEKNYEKSLRKQEYGVPSRVALDKLVSDGGIVAPKAGPGSVILFDSNTMHGSNGNMSPQPRINLFAVYNSVENGLKYPFGDQPPRPNYLAEREITPVRAL